MPFIGHQKIINLLERSVKKGKIAQAYLFSGPESVGKFTLAKIFAGRLIENQGDWGDLGNFWSLEDLGKTVDLMVVEPEREEKKGVVKEKDIPIEQMREAQKFLLTFPGRGKYKILIINDAHRMTGSAQNSLLKILEEPNSTSIIILVSRQPAKIFPTLKSRCRKINFSLVDEKAIREGLKQMKIKAGSEIFNFSLGRPGLVIKLAENKETLGSWREFAEILEKISSLGVNGRLALAEKLSKNIPETVKKLEIWIWLIRNKTLSNKRVFPGEDFRKISLIEKSVLEITETNANSRLVLENLLINL